jgi:hypothetical protein
MMKKIASVIQRGHFLSDNLLNLAKYGASGIKSSFRARLPGRGHAAITAARAFVDIDNRSRSA